MLSVGFQAKSNIHFNNNTVATNLKRSQNNIAFKGNVATDAFVLMREAAPVAKTSEFLHIADALKTLGVKELELGDNIVLARLLKGAIQRVKLMGYDVPTKIRCEAEHFEDNKALRYIYKRAYPNDIYKPENLPASVSWDANTLSVPIIYLNPKYDWEFGVNRFKIPDDKKFIIWHEIGHWIHMKNHGNNPDWLRELSEIQLDSSVGPQIEAGLGRFRSDNPIPETIADTFGMIMMGRSYHEMPAIVRSIYEKYRGPMPQFRASNAG